MNTELDKYKKEITPEMLEAGIEILYASGMVDGRIDADGLVLAEIYCAMRAAQKTDCPDFGIPVGKFMEFNTRNFTKKEYWQGNW